MFNDKQTPTHFIIFSEPRPHGRTNFIPRDERTLKMQEHLKKRLKERQASGHTTNKLNSPPSPHKVHNSSNISMQNGNGKGQQVAGAPLKQKQVGKARGSPPADAEMGGRYWTTWERNKLTFCKVPKGSSRSKISGLVSQ